jgi:hypothetical protein
MSRNLVFGAYSSKAYPLTANKTLGPRDNGKTFTNRGATGTVTVTLPKASAALNGWSVRLMRFAAQSFVVASDPVDTLVISADAAADTVTIATIGHGVEVFCDGTSFYAVLVPGAAATIISGTTVAT